jgi:hypothetical protein
LLAMMLVGLELDSLVRWVRDVVGWLRGRGSGWVMCGVCGVLCSPLDRGENTLIPVLHAVRTTSNGRIQKGQIGETVGTGRCRPIRTSRLVQKSQYGGIGTQVGSASEDVRPERQSDP